MRHPGFVRLIVPQNHQVAANGAADRQANLKALEDQRKQGGLAPGGEPTLSPFSEGRAARKLFK